MVLSVIDLGLVSLVYELLIMSEAEFAFSNVFLIALGAQS